MNLEYEQLNAFNVEKDVSLAKVKLTFNHIDLTQLVNERQLNFIVKAHVQVEAIKVEILINTRIFNKSFMNINFVKKHKFSTIELRNSIKLRLIDNKSTLNITHMSQLKFSLETHMNEIWCLVTKLEKYFLILSMSWLKEHMINIKSKNRALQFFNSKCIVNCLRDHKLTTIYNSESRTRQVEASLQDKDIHLISTWAFIKMIDKKNNEIIVMWFEHFETLNQSKKNDKYLIKHSFSTIIAIISVVDY